MATDHVPLKRVPFWGTHLVADLGSQQRPTGRQSLHHNSPNPASPIDYVLLPTMPAADLGQGVESYPASAHGKRHPRPFVRTAEAWNFHHLIADCGGKAAGRIKRRNMSSGWFIRMLSFNPVNTVTISCCGKTKMNCPPRPLAP